MVSYEASKDIERGPSSTGWAWDDEFFDFDLDGDDELYVVNGGNEYAFHTYKTSVTVHESGKVSHYQFGHDRETNVFYVNQGGKLVNVSPDSGADSAGNSRSTAYLDLDDDGDLDIAINNFHAPATVLRNHSEVGGRNWIKVELVVAASIPRWPGGRC